MLEQVDLENALVALQHKYPIRPFEWSDSLALSAKEHCMDLGPKGMVSEEGSAN
jgi:hypothetical protein